MESQHHSQPQKKGQRKGHEPKTGDLHPAAQKDCEHSGAEAQHYDCGIVIQQDPCESQDHGPGKDQIEDPAWGGSLEFGRDFRSGELCHGFTSEKD